MNGKCKRERVGTECRPSQGLVRTQDWQVRECETTGTTETRLSDELLAHFFFPFAPVNLDVLLRMSYDVTLHEATQPTARVVLFQQQGTTDSLPTVSLGGFHVPSPRHLAAGVN